MPRIKGLSSEQKTEHQKQILTEHCLTWMHRADLKKIELAAAVGITPQAIGAQFKNNSLTTEVIIAIVSLTNPPAEEIKQTLMY